MIAENNSLFSNVVICRDINMMSIPVLNTGEKLRCRAKIRYHHKPQAAVAEMTDENTLVLVTITVPHEIENMTVNLKAPIIINTKSRQAMQVIVENEDYAIKYNVYEVYEALKKLEESE